MNARILAVLNAVMFNTLVLTMCLLLIPVVGHAEAKATENLELAALTSPEQFIEYASINDESIHDLYFSVILYEGTESCLMCHQEEGEAALDMGHFKWEGTTNNVVGLEGEVVGKNNLINNFCMAVATNEGRCTQCHAGYGYNDKNFDFTDPTNVDCLVCHDQSGTYKKAPTLAGLPDPSVDLNIVAQSIAISGTPTRKNCIACHAFAGGGDNVKHGDLSSDLVATTRDFDVHMGADGANMDCVACHGSNHDPKTGAVNHGNAGMSLHSVNEGEMKQCTDCHGSQMTIHAGLPSEDLFTEGWHERLACQVCHIPAIARAVSTKTEWYWSDAGQNVDPIPIDPETGRPTYDKKKGTFVWSNNVRPSLRYANGTWTKTVLHLSDKYDEEPISLAAPQGSYSDPDAMIYPFKRMVGNQPVDPNTRTVLVPHLFGKTAGPNPYWGKFDWPAALADGAAYTGQDYSGTHVFGTTEMFLSVNHEVAPAEQALGYGTIPDNCIDCHSTDYIEWEELGWTDDPLQGGKRDETSAINIPGGNAFLDSAEMKPVEDTR